MPIDPETIRCNAERATRFQAALDTYGDDHDAPTLFCDLLADAMHWCRMQDHDFTALFERARNHHLAEAMDEGVEP